MNICNFAKVFIARATKDTESIKFWREKDEMEDGEQKKKTKCPPIPKYDTTISPAQRYTTYLNYIESCPKLFMEFEQFRRNLPRVQKYITKNTYWKNCNKDKDKSLFVQTFSVFSWAKLSLSKKKNHVLYDCNECLMHNPIITSAHASAESSDTNIVSVCTQVTDAIIENSPPNKPEKCIQTFVRVLSPITQNRLGVDLVKTVSKAMKLTPKKTQEEKRKSKENIVKESKKSIATTMESNDQDVDNFLASGKSYNQYDRDRLFTYHISKDEAEERTRIRFEKENTGKVKPKKHHGHFDNYVFDKDGFIKEMKAMEPGANISWRKLGIQFDVKNSKGQQPMNAGEVLKEFAKSKGINVNSFNLASRISGRDYLSRIRRAKKTMAKRISIPQCKSASAIRRVIKQRIDTGVINLGRKITPTTITSSSINKCGTLVKKETSVYSRKFDIKTLREEFLEEHMKAGIMRTFTDETYNDLSVEEIKKRYLRIGEEISMTNGNTLERLKKMERTRHFKLWHDHSDILNHTFISFMVSVVYDTALFLTDEEYKQKFPTRKPVDVASIVERPKLYILGQSKSSDKQQLAYVKERLKDLDEIGDPIIKDGVPLFDVFRFFSGDGPARQFEAGQQRGGHYSCICGIRADEHKNLPCSFTRQTRTLEERRQVFVGGVQWRKLKDGEINPFLNLKKDDLAEELEERGVNTVHMDKSMMQHALQDEVEGIQRPPALMCDNPSKTASEINCENYEVLACEPLHDITNIVQNLITELPYHLNNKNTKKEYEDFCQTTIGEKNQIKGSDARLYAIRLSKFTENMYKGGKVSNNILLLCNSLVDIINICYGKYENRNGAEILRLYNQCYVFATMCFLVIGNPKKMTERKFYGNHFHSLVTHAPETYRIVSLRSIIPEQEERSFGDLRAISKNTSNRQPSNVVDNAVLRFPSQQKYKRDSFKKQESIISHEAHLLTKRTNTQIPIVSILKFPYRFQAHLQRLSDFLLCGKGQWWTCDESSVIFHDVSKLPSSNQTHLHHFRSKSIKEMQQYLNECWTQCLTKLQAQEIEIPLHKIKIYRNSKLSEIISTDVFHDDTDDSLDLSKVSEDDTNNYSATNEDPSNIEDATETNMETYSDHDMSDVIPSQNILREQDYQEEELCSKNEKSELHNRTDHGQDGVKALPKQAEILRKNYNETIKRKYAEYRADLKQSSTCTDKKLKPSAAKRKLFKTDLDNKEQIDTQDSESEMACPFKSDNSEEEEPQQSMEEKIEERIPTSQLIIMVLGETEDVKNFLKYRRLANNIPTTFLPRYQMAKAIIETRLLKQHTELKKKTSNSNVKKQLKMVETIMDRWGTYYQY